MGTTRKDAQKGELFTALFDERGNPRHQWLSVIDAKVFAGVRAAIPDIVELVFAELSGRYLDRVAAEGLPDGMTAYGYLSGRFMWDAGRAAAALAREYCHDGLEHDDGTPIAELAVPDDKVVDESERLLAAIRGLLPRLDPQERAAFEARLASGFDAAATYDRLGLGKEERNTHNNAWLAARRKMARWLSEIGWGR